MHGEARHLSQHAALARSAGVKTVIEARNGDVVRLLPEPAEIIDEAPTGRLFRDGNLIIPAEANAIAERRRLARLGVVTASIVLTAKGELAAEPRIFLAGLPDFDGGGRPMQEAAMDALMSALDGIPRPRRKDSNLVGEAMRRGLRAGLADAWGKRPICAVMVTMV
jgi:ribonuclease J